MYNVHVGACCELQLEDYNSDFFNLIPINSHRTPALSNSIERSQEGFFFFFEEVSQPDKHQDLQV